MRIRGLECQVAGYAQGCYGRKIILGNPGSATSLGLR